jgi:hypothetical protein
LNPRGGGTIDDIDSLRFSGNLIKIDISRWGFTAGPGERKTLAGKHLSVPSILLVSRLSVGLTERIARSFSQG